MLHIHTGSWFYLFLSPVFHPLLFFSCLLCALDSSGCFDMFTKFSEVTSIHLPLPPERVSRYWSAKAEGRGRTCFELSFVVILPESYKKEKAALKHDASTSKLDSQDEVLMLMLMYCVFFSSTHSVVCCSVTTQLCFHLSTGCFARSAVEQQHALYKLVSRE